MHGNCHSQLDSGASTETAPPQWETSRAMESAKLTLASSASTRRLSGEESVATPCNCPAARRGLGGFGTPGTGRCTALESDTCPMVAMRKSAWAVYWRTVARSVSVFESDDSFGAEPNGVTRQPHHERAQLIDAPVSRVIAAGAPLPVRISPGPASGCDGVGVFQAFGQ